MSEEKIVVGDTQVTLSSPKKRRKWGRMLMRILVLGGVVGLFVYGLIAAKNGNVEGNDILVTSGSIEVIIAVIGIKVLLRREKKICPECGTGREHHRKWIGTSEQYKNSTELAKIIYTHEYIDSWVCPKCGETVTEKVKKSGGELIEYRSGRVQDNRRSPSEF